VCLRALQAAAVGHGDEGVADGLEVAR